MNVLYLISRAKVSGPVNQALNILIGLNRCQGVHASLVTLAPEVVGNSWLDRFKANDINVVQLNQTIFNTYKCVSLLKRYIKDNHVDVVHSAGYRADFVNMQLCGYVKTVSTQRCRPDEIVEKFPRLLRHPFEKLHIRIIMKMNSIVACSNSLKRVFQDEYGITVDCVQNGVNTNLFCPVNRRSLNEIRNKLGISQGKIVYLVLGSLRQRKNVSLIINAFSSIHNPSACLLIVGTGPQEDYLKQLAKGDERIQFVGSTETPLNYIQASDFLISSSLAEGLPNTVLEALACGLPVILSDIDPHKEIIKGYTVGGLFENNDVKCLKKMICDSFNWNYELLSSNCRSLVDKKFSINTLSYNYSQIYHKLIEK